MQDATAFFNKTYDEAFALLVEARNYVAHEQAADADAAGMWGRARLSLETTRLTSRLGHVMAWLLARKAVHAGEISREAAGKPPYALDCNETVAANEGPLADPLPPHLESLMARSQRLYTRVTRLDELVQRDATPD